MKSYLLATCLFGVVALSSCETTSTGAPTSAVGTSQVGAYQAAQAEVTRLTAEANQNALLKPWTGPHGGVPPWDQANAAAMPAAFQLGIRLQAAEIDVIAQNPAAATFENTMAPLDDSGRHLGRAQTLFSVMTQNISTPEIQAVDAE